jgi:thiamine biosynthesis lipoprotein
MPKISAEPVVDYKRHCLNGPTMGTRWSASFYAESTIDFGALHLDLSAAVHEVDEQMSPWKPNSDLMRLNRAPVDDWVDLSSEILEVLDCALDIRRLSAAAFDPYVGALVDAWGFGSVRDKPDAQAIRSAHKSTPSGEHECLELDRPAGRARKCATLQLDLCGITKGYAVDRMVKVLQQHRVRHALAALDGELCGLGSKATGLPWDVAIERPEFGHRAVHGVIELEDLAIASSGDYRHYLEVGGVRIAHTMDSRRGGPVNNAVASVTVLAHTCMVADAWATAFLVAGPEEGLAMANRMEMEVLFLLRNDEGLMELGTGRFSRCTDRSNLASKKNTLVAKP